MSFLSFVLFILMLGGTALVTSSQNVAPCPCEKPSLCLPIKNTTRREVFAFSVSQNMSQWMMYDWSKLTTVVMVGYINSRLLCLAHSRNTRVSYIANSDKVNFTDPSSRQAWINQQIKLVEVNYLDGLNFDFQGVITQADNASRDGYTSLVAETKSALNKTFPYFQVTVDVPWKPNADIRFFDFKGLAAHSDFLFVMAYEEQSQIFGECIAGPNSAYHLTFEGLHDYMSSGIPLSKLVLGVPWYGYIYPCVTITNKNTMCHMKSVSYRGVNCSDAIGKQYSYGTIYAFMRTRDLYGTWNATSLSRFISYEDPDKTLHQVQYDDTESLIAKYSTAVNMNVRGVGMWTIDDLDYSNTDDGRRIRHNMFGALPDFN